MRVNRKELSAAINAVSRFTNPRSPKPAMQCIQLESDGSTLKVRGCGTYGSASVSMQCDGKATAIVTASSFCKTVDLLPDSEIEIKEVKNKVRIKGASSSIEVPSQTVTMELPTGKPGPKAVADASSVMHCIDTANTVGSNVEMHYANGVRIYVLEDTMHFSSSTSKNSAFSWCPCKSGEIDAVVTRGGIPALTKLLGMISGDVTIEDRDSHVAFYSGGIAAVMLKEASGRQPSRYDKVKGMWQSANKWRVSRTGLSEFIRYAMAVSTPEASGVWLKPTNDGLMCQYTGISDGTYALDLSVEATCETKVSGEPCTGIDAYISCRQLAPALAAMSDDGFVINAVDGHALILESENAVIGIGQLNHPVKATAS